MNAILYVARTGIPWRYLPHDFPPHQTVYGYFARWEADGIFDQLTGLLRDKIRQAEGRTTEPSACLIDSQSIKTSTTVPLTSQGIDPAKKIIGRKRHIVTLLNGLVTCRSCCPWRRTVRSVSVSVLAASSTGSDWTTSDAMSSTAA